MGGRLVAKGHLTSPPGLYTSFASTQSDKTIDVNRSMDPLGAAFTLRASSGEYTNPCIDSGDPATPVPAGGGARVDVGAFEYSTASAVSPALSVIGTLEIPVVLGATWWSGAPDASKWPRLTVDLRDELNRPVAGKTVVFRFASAGVRLLSTQRAGVALDCGARTLSVVTDAAGRASFHPQFGGYDNTPVVTALVDGQPIRTLAARSVDIDAMGGANAADLSLLMARYYNANTSPEGDFNFDGVITVADASMFLNALSGTPQRVDYCP